MGTAVPRMWFRYLVTYMHIYQYVRKLWCIQIINIFMVTLGCHTMNACTPSCFKIWRISFSFKGWGWIELCEHWVSFVYCNLSQCEYTQYIKIKSKLRQRKSKKKFYLNHNTGLLNINGLVNYELQA